MIRLYDLLQNLLQRDCYRVHCLVLEIGVHHQGRQGPIELPVALGSHTHILDFPGLRIEDHQKSDACQTSHRDEADLPQ